LSFEIKIAMKNYNLKFKILLFVFLSFITSHLSLISVFAQGTCTAIIEHGQCTLDTNNCDAGYQPRVQPLPACRCTCEKTSSAIPRYEDIPEFKESYLAKKWATIGDIFSDALRYLFIFAGLGVFIFLIYGGLHLMISGGDPTAIAEAKGKITNAIIGFIIIFTSYWLIQIIEVVFGMKIL